MLGTSDGPGGCDCCLVQVSQCLWPRCEERVALPGEEACGGPWGIFWMCQPDCSELGFPQWTARSLVEQHQDPESHTDLKPISLFRASLSSYSTA